MTHYLAISANGLEHLLAEELKSLGVTDVKLVQAGVRFSADNALMYRCCLWSRLASRFVRIISEFQCNDDLDLYLAVSAINWSTHFSSNKRLIVDFNGTNRSIRNSQYGAMKVKDGIVDSFTKRNLGRPDISKDQPDLRIHVRLHKEHAILGIDMVLMGLHQRGYRTQAGAAPLRETLACTILLRSGWSPSQPLFDPMCGSGTLLIEAALMAANIAPNAQRQRWGFESLSDFDNETWLTIKSEAKVQGRKGLKNIENVQFFGVDNDARIVQTARDNIRRAGLESIIEVIQGDATKVTKEALFEEGIFDNGMIVSNPPYGERLGTEPGLIALYTALGDQFKRQFPNTKVSLLSSSEELLSCLRMRADKQYKLNNGPILCYQKNYFIAQKSEAELNRQAQASSEKMHKGQMSQGQMSQGQANQEQTNNTDNDNANEASEPQIAPDFANRLKKNQAKIAKWAKKEGLDCYRVYDADLPNYNVAIDRYQDQVVIQEYAPPKTIPEEVAKRRLTDIIRATMTTLGVDANNIVLKTREKQKGKRQYQKLSEASKRLEIQEYGVKLLVNLQDYLDTGLFLDHKLTRRRLAELAKGKDFLNLFAYTGSASVHAAFGGAKSTTTVDMSHTYLQWAQDNMALNGFTGDEHHFEQADCLQWLSHESRQFDLIFIDPPTFSNSKRMDQSFDIQRDHLMLMTNLKRLLRDDGVIVFSNNKRQFKMDLDGLKALDLDAKNISEQTRPLDFARNKHIHNCWLIRHQNTQEG